MKSYSFALIASAVSAGYSKQGYVASEGHGTTGHYGNQYGHGGYDDHSHQDHIYGYDSVEQDLNLDEAAQEALRDLVIAEVENAN